MRLPNLVDAFLATLETDGKAANTRRAYGADLRGFAAFCGEAEPNRMMVRRFLAGLHTAGTRPSTVARKLAALRTFMAWAVSRGKLPADATAELRPPKQGRRLPHTPTEAQMIAILEAAREAAGKGASRSKQYERGRDYALLELAYATGARQDELVRIDLDHVCWDEGLVKVTGKGSKERFAPFGEPARAALLAYIEQRAALVARLQDERRHWPDPKIDPRALFLSRLGERLCGRQVQRLVKEAGRAAGLDNLHPHLLRHACGSHLWARGCDLRIVGAMLGHAKMGTTQLYVRSSQGRTFDAYRAAHPRASA